MAYIPWDFAKKVPGSPTNNRQAYTSLLNFSQSLSRWSLAGKMDVRVSKGEADWLRAFVRKKCADSGIAIRSLASARRAENLLYGSRYAYAYRTKKKRSKESKVQLAGMPLVRVLELINLLQRSPASSGMTMADWNEVLKRSGFLRLYQERAGGARLSLIVFNGEADEITRNLIHYLRVNGHIGRKSAKTLEQPISEYFAIAAQRSDAELPLELREPLNKWRAKYAAIEPFFVETPVQ